MLNYKPNAHGSYTPAIVAPECDNSQTGTTSLSHSAGAVWGDRHGPLLYLTCAFYFMT
jgi:hypothetical protein